MTAKTGFADRLSYVRWLRNRGRVEAESDGAFAALLGVSAAWFSKWKGSVTPPNTRDQIKRVVAALHPMGVTEPWLLDGEGTPPEPDRWQEWERHRVQLMQEAAANAGRGKFYGADRTPAKPAAAKNVANARRKPR